MTRATRTRTRAWRLKPAGALAKGDRIVLEDSGQVETVEAITTVPERPSIVRVHCVGRVPRFYHVLTTVRVLTLVA